MVGVTKPRQCDEHCQGCRYFYNLGVCTYYEYHGIRPCPPGKACTVKVEGKMAMQAPTVSGRTTWERLLPVMEDDDGFEY